LTTARAASSDRNDFNASPFIQRLFAAQKAGPVVRKLIAFDDDTLDKLKQLGRERMATFQELADEAFADVLKKHGIPIDLKDALRKSASLSKTATPKKARSNHQRKMKS
jgi:non-homologous end joining protein Ku